ncbi:Mechanosensitive channel of small conductance-like 10 MscS-Like protein [Vigna angularis]|uniref:Mechanosensitive ion channel protein n=1 Tax=Phaseolus angularis TaxID=3914 RepID=A0A8T0KL14_PHAAN|nr:mechanosensitive ion channel protein 10 [Vigna angularis]KAG2398645.1 Mechanosensitive channel of small conductance-like 10 MscS-Like protein [Vigna angularis]
MEEERSVADKKVAKNEVVLRISDSEGAMNAEIKDSGSFPVAGSSSLSPQHKTQINKRFKDSGGEITEPLRNKDQVSTKWMTTTKRLIGQSEFSKPKSRMVDPPCPRFVKFVEEKVRMTSSFAWNSRNRNVSEATTDNPRTPLLGTPAEEEDDDEEVYMIANFEVAKRSGRKWRVFELFAFAFIMGFFIASLSLTPLQKRELWGLKMWKWCVFILAILCGRLVTEWFINVLVFLIERNFLFKKKVLYFVYGVKKSVQGFIWLSLVLLTWDMLFSPEVEKTSKVGRILDYIALTLASCLIGAALWLAKALLIKLLASSFQSTRFFDRVHESIFHQYILKTLSGPPLMEMAEKVGTTSNNDQLSYTTMLNKKEGEKGKVIDADKLKKMTQKKVSPLTMKGLINVIRSSGLSTISYAQDDDENEQKDNEINSGWEAKAAAYRIFMNVAKPGHKYIEIDDLLRFMKIEEVENLLPLFEGAVETRRIKRKSLKNWLVKVYLGRKSLIHSLNDTNTAVDDLNILASAVVVIVTLIVWLLLTGVLTTEVLVFISSQLLLVGFMFGNTAKTVFEAIIFVFVVHPFDVGDRCVIDGVQMVVEEMNILTTVFLRYDNEKIFYPNSVLSNKPISNFNRSPEMSDAVEFVVDVSTSIESIGALKAKLKVYLESRPQYWHTEHDVLVNDIENVNKMKMAVYVTHTINFQNYWDRSCRRSELVLELKKILQDLNIKYHLLPQEVHVNYVRSPDSTLQAV